LELAPEVAELVDRRELEMGHARALLGLSELRQQAEVARLVSKKSLSVRETEALVRRLTNTTGGEGGETGRTGGGGRTGRDPNVTALESRLAETLGAKVVIDHSGKTGKGRVVVSYNSLDELDGILQHIH
jgi:ParB family chromosome partitioning protein